MKENEITEKIIGCAIKVHSNLGPGLLESAYKECLFYELTKSGLFFKDLLNSFKISLLIILTPF